MSAAESITDASAPPRARPGGARVVADGVRRVHPGPIVAVDGVSLTIAGLTEEAFEVALVRHTLDATTLGSLQAGDEVNLEVDVLAKYVERLAAR